MKRAFRLTHSTDFYRTRNTGSSYSHPYFVINAVGNSLSVSRFGISTSHYIGNAVQRNQVKRRLKACLDLVFPRFNMGWDVVITTRKKILLSDFNELRHALETTLEKASVLRRTDSEDEPSKRIP